MESTEPHCVAALVNHSSSANAEFIWGNGLLWLAVKQKISQGDELLVDYGKNWLGFDKRSKFYKGFDWDTTLAAALRTNSLRCRHVDLASTLRHLALEQRQGHGVSSQQSEVRTSTSTWCRDACKDDPHMRRIYERVSNVTRVPAAKKLHEWGV